MDETNQIMIEQTDIVPTNTDQNDINQTDLESVVVKFFSSKWILFLAIASLIVIIIAIAEMIFTKNNLFYYIMNVVNGSIVRLGEDYGDTASISPGFHSLALSIVLFIMYINAKKNSTKPFKTCYLFIIIVAIISIVTSIVYFVPSIIDACRGIYEKNWIIAILYTATTVGTFSMMTLNLYISRVAVCHRDKLFEEIDSSRYLYTIAVFFFLIGGLSVIASVLSAKMIYSNLLAALLDIYTGIVVIVYADKFKKVFRPNSEQYKYQKIFKKRKTKKTEKLSEQN